MQDLEILHANMIADCRPVNVKYALPALVDKSSQYALPALVDKSSRYVTVHMCDVVVQGDVSDPWSPVTPQTDQKKRKKKTVATHTVTVTPTFRTL